MNKSKFYIICIVVFLLILEISIYWIYVYKNIKHFNSTDFELPRPYQYSLKYNYFRNVYNTKTLFKKPINFGDKHKILLFGCSFAYGAQLAENEAFDYRLAKKYNSTVYNRSMPGWGLHLMYYQMENNSLNALNIDKDVDTIIYVYIDDHINRLYNFYHGFIYDNIFSVRYELKNNKIKEKEIHLPFINSFFIVKALRDLAQTHQKQDPQYREKSHDLLLSLFKASHEKLQESYPNAKFVLIEYNSITLEKLKDKLKESGWEYYSTNDILPSNINLYDDIYHFKNDCHPSGKAWEVIVDSIENKKILY